jgi:hypothetical protein
MNRFLHPKLSQHLNHSGESFYLDLDLDLLLDLLLVLDFDLLLRLLDWDLRAERDLDAALPVLFLEPFDRLRDRLPERLFDRSFDLLWD